VPFPMTIVEGKEDTHVHVLRDVSGGEGQLVAGMWRAGVCTIDYHFAGDETVHVLRGEADVELDSGETVTLRAGDIASFPKGAHSTWRVRSPIEKFFVISG
jgi:uncharacterized protein